MATSEDIKMAVDNTRGRVLPRKAPKLVLIRSAPTLPAVAC